MSSPRNRTREYKRKDPYKLYSLPRNAYPPARDFCHHDIITLDPTYRYKVPDWLVLGRTYKVVARAWHEITYGHDMLPPRYDEYLLPPDPKGYKMPIWREKASHLLCVRLDSDDLEDDQYDDIKPQGVYAKVGGRTIAGYPACKQGDAAYNAALRIASYLRYESRIEQYQSTIQKYETQIEDMREENKSAMDHMQHLNTRIRYLEHELDRRGAQYDEA